ncbi:MAG: 3-hydroxyisobutyrate dehydrogenase-like beta-hydroxyacid dehydrogenase [Paracoccaceae bacterium]|jgi:3-hydroxyisobutyrate dehydrogenase-like beta-hydroxyacid dehydrogenase
MSELTAAFLGTGLMGAPMARNLLASGVPVTVWNRSMEKAQALAANGATVAATAAEAVKGADFVITMLSDGAAVADLLFGQGVAAAMKPGAALIDMSSIKPEQAREIADRLASMGLGALDAPVSGGTRGAAGATLAIMAGGDQATFDAARPLLAAMGRPVRVGPSGAGQLSKLANQVIVAVTIGVVAEAMLFAQKGGADPAAIRDALRGGFADSVILQQHGERMTTGDFTPGGPSHLQLKDIDNALIEAKAVGLTLPLVEQMQDRFGRFVRDLDGAQKDHSGIYLELLDINGLA